MMKKSGLICALFVIALPAFAGGGWTKEKGKGYFKLSQNFIRGDNFYSGDAEIITIATTGVYTTSFYAEYGLTDRLEFSAYIPFFVRNAKNAVEFNDGVKIEGDELNSFGDMILGLKYGIIQKGPVVLSGSLIFGVPSGNNAGGETKLLQTGDGEFNQMIRLDASRSFYPLPFYMSTHAAFNNRTNDFSDDFRWGIEAGYQFNKLWATVRINSVHSFFNGDAAITDNGIFANNTEYFSPAVELAYSFSKNWGASLEGGFAFFGRNILAVPSFTIGVYYDLK